MDNVIIKEVKASIRNTILGWDWERLSSDRKELFLDEVAENAIKVAAAIILDEASEAVTCCPCCADDVLKLKEKYR